MRSSAEYLNETFLKRYDQDILPLLRLCQSELEQRVLHDMLSMGETVELIWAAGTVTGAKITLLGFSVEIYPQYWIGEKRTDFAVIKLTEEWGYRFAFECDSYSYHSTQSDKLRDNVRDEIYRNHGWKPVILEGYQANDTLRTQSMFLQELLNC